MAQLIKNLPAMKESQVLFQVREDPLEKEMAIHSSILAWKILWLEDWGDEAIFTTMHCPWYHDENVAKAAAATITVIQ